MKSIETSSFIIEVSALHIPCVFIFDVNWHLMQYKIKSLCKESDQKLRDNDFYRYIKQTKENYVVVKK